MGTFGNGNAYDIEAVVRGDRDFLWHHMKPHKCFENQEQMIIVEGDGLMVRDIRGREYLDASSGGVWSVVTGYGRHSIADAVADQLKKMAYFAGVYGNVPAIQFAAKLVELMPSLHKVYFSNSGSEANEKAFKIIRQAAAIVPQRKGRYKILYRDRDYHGTTLAALSATGQEERKKDFGPLVPGFVSFPHALCYRCAFEKAYPDCNLDCARVVEKVIEAEGPESVGALIVEPITAGGGIIPPVKEYYPILQEICRRYDVKIIMDEVVCGFGRTGKFWGYEHFDVDPDLVTLAKGLVGGYLPLSATVVRQEIFDMFLNDPADPAVRLDYFRDISTYGGCAGVFAGALENVRIIEDEGLVANSRDMGAYLLDRLQELADLPIVGDVRGRGLFCGIEFVEDKTTRKPVSEAAMARIMGDLVGEGVLAGRTNGSIPGLNNIMNFAPALVITRAQVDRIVAAVKRAIEKSC
jgi:taurine-pyruvate aminotransferase